MLKIYFMFDNHTFQRIHIRDKDQMIGQIMGCFADDNNGGVFCRNVLDERPKEILDLNGVYNKETRKTIAPSYEEVGNWVDIAVSYNEKSTKDREELKKTVCKLFEFGEDKWFDYEDEFTTLWNKAIEVSAKQAKGETAEKIRMNKYA